MSSELRAWVADNILSFFLGIAGIFCLWMFLYMWLS